MIAQAVMYPDFPKGLDFITSIHTKEPYYKDEGKKWFKMNSTEEDFWIYNAKDSVVAFEALGRLYGDLVGQDNLDAYKEQARLIEPIIYMNERGMKVDFGGLDKASRDADDQIKTLTQQFKDICGYDLNVGSPAQLKDYFYKVRGKGPMSIERQDRQQQIKTLSRDSQERGIKKLLYFLKFVDSLNLKIHISTSPWTKTIDFDVLSIQLVPHQGDSPVPKQSLELELTCRTSRMSFDSTSLQTPTA
jgi:DNA polymerase I - 3'-5' exonuclease and polymerase domains